MSTSLNLVTFLTMEHVVELLRGLRFTMILAAASWLLAAVVGILLAMLREGGGRLIQLLAAGFVAYQRNVPALAHLMLWYFGVPSLLPRGAQTWINANNGEMILAFISMGLSVGAYFCEDIRSGLRSIPYGQQEASRAIGLSYLQTMRYVILPQALRIALPPLVNHTVLLFKNTSLAMAVGATELMYAVQEIQNETFRTFDAYLVATIIYLAVTLGLMGAGVLIARRYRIPAR
ncbi:amino acid ABC transporter permease [Paraburkholderia fungorum]|uniref:Amino acid ABC transporter permease n=1 Tax=Paraburkholderia fungorum TaxID=134537 RepID=A0A3R7IIK9_9BURK|nr:amino acid ABC transporter permease [Paraburkholderia fungorum]RKF34432.1 amino acid ABC transporter permease [Paraburkholderia fungorum]